MLTELCKDVEVAVEDISKETRHDLWRAIGEWEDRLAEKSLLQRVKEARKMREREHIRVVPYEPCYKNTFKLLNVQWITKHWKIEPHDLDYLDHPQEYIINKGGFIFVALYRGKPVGVCALCKWMTRYMIMNWRNLPFTLMRRAKASGKYFAMQP